MLRPPVFTIEVCNTMRSSTTIERSGNDDIAPDEDVLLEEVVICAA